MRVLYNPTSIVSGLTGGLVGRKPKRPDVSSATEAAEAEEASAAQAVAAEQERTRKRGSRARSLIVDPRQTTRGLGARTTLGGG